MSRIFSALLSVVLTLLLFLPSPAWAASSAATRANDDLKVTDNNFSGRNLQEAEFAEARLSGANFSNAKLEGVVFNASNVSKANFQDANLSYGFAYLTSFIESDFRNAVLVESTFLQCSLRDANVTGADFSNSIIDKDQLVELCKTADGVNPVTGVSTRESLECP